MKTNKALILLLGSFSFVVGSSIDANSVAASCILHCKGDSTPYPNPDYIKTANGCGSKGITIDAALLPKPQMELCCDAHDYCYDTCNNAKSTCDTVFKSCLLEVCGPGLDIKSIYCKATADLFYDIVKEIGCSSFTDAQKNTCLCPSALKISSAMNFV